MGFDFAELRRRPDVEAPNLFAADAADRLILDEAADLLAAQEPNALAIVNDGYGALTLGAAALHGATGVRTHQDALSGERALAANAEHLGLTSSYRSVPELGSDLLTGARVVLLRLPRGLDALDEIAQQVAAFAHPEVVVVAGGMLKHMTTAMNDVLAAHFARIDVTLARQKARVLIARGPRSTHSSWPKRVHVETLDLEVVAHGAAFAGASVDIGTRLLLAHIDDAMTDADAAIDLGCGTGVIATALARRRPHIAVLATDQSAAAVASARATVAANGVADRVTVVRDDALTSQPDGSARFIALNPPFHIGATVHAGIALKLFADAGRVLAPGGELWTVWNSHLRYRSALERLVGPTRQIARNPTFTVTASRRR
ncbi:methyltransferase [Rathayibacter sp. YIM 133350]|uniref:class I SAM-dependent methyltransferase n=1 Tax=Rathayibacter sp. YIM 133350 TaxID=3131992 RepID=UPI00307EBF2B